VSPKFIHPPILIATPFKAWIKMNAAENPALAEHKFG
jgi:hypothetical protein